MSYSLSLNRDKPALRKTLGPGGLAFSEDQASSSTGYSAAKDNAETYSSSIALAKSIVPLVIKAGERSCMPNQAASWTSSPGRNVPCILCT